MADQRQKCRTVAILTPAIRLNDLECLPEIAPLIKAQSTSTSGCTQMPVSWQGSMRGACALAAVNYLDRCLRRFLLSLLILFFFHCTKKVGESASYKFALLDAKATLLLAAVHALHPSVRMHSCKVALIEQHDASARPGKDATEDTALCKIHNMLAMSQSAAWQRLAHLRTHVVRCLGVVRAAERVVHSPLLALEARKTLQAARGPRHCTMNP